MKSVLIINGHDYSHYIVSKGVSWTRNSMDSEKSNRNVMTGRMNRYPIADKRTVSYTLMDLSREELAQLDSDLSATFFTATYLDLHGVTTKDFYCTSFKATTDVVHEDDSTWCDASFTMIER